MAHKLTWFDGKLLIFASNLFHIKTSLYISMMGSCSGRRVANYFRTTDVTKIDLRSCIVYQYTCTSCQTGYIGQTSRHLRHSVAKHRGVSHFTYNEVKYKVHSNIREHCHHCPGSVCS